jgi:TRAP-type uncharacterized transport system substrate-binding protein
MTNYKRYTNVYKAMDLVKENEVVRDAGIPFHPGALKYYKERGWIK